jgi:hypothetical protein
MKDFKTCRLRTNPPTSGVRVPSHSLFNPYVIHLNIEREAFFMHDILPLYNSYFGLLDDGCGLEG